MNFKIEQDDSEETTSKTRIKSDKFMIIIIVVISLVCGLTVFLISNAIFGKKKTPPVEVVDTKINTSDETVQILYSYVAHDSRNKSDGKFLKNNKVLATDFTNEEKYNYALQFVQPEDLSFDGELTEKNEKIYFLNDKRIKNYMQRFFGTKVNYTNEKELTYAFDFSINNKNLGVLEYNSKDSGYNVHFIDLEDNQENKDLVEPYYTELYEALRKPDSSIEIKEKVIYTELKENAGVYELNIYKDYEKTKLIEKKSNLTLEELKSNPIQMKKYLDNAATVTYLFKVENTRFYFYSSTISN